MASTGGYRGPTTSILSCYVHHADFVGCAELGIHDTDSLFFPGFRRSEVVGFIAGLGTTFAALPDLIAMLRRRSSKGMNPMMAATMGAFQIVRDCAYGDGEWSIRSCSTMT